MKCQDIFFILAKNSGKIVKKVYKIAKKRENKIEYINIFNKTQLRSNNLFLCLQILIYFILLKAFYINFLKYFCKIS